jgi:hypothetical protein
LKRKNWRDRYLVGIFFAVIGVAVGFDLLIASLYSSEESQESSPEVIPTPSPTSVPSIFTATPINPEETPTPAPAPTNVQRRPARTNDLQGKIVVGNYGSAAIYVTAVNKTTGYKSSTIPLYPGKLQDIKMTFGEIVVTANGTPNGNFIRSESVTLSKEQPRKPIYFR